MATAWPYATPQWRRLRLAKLAASPWCEPCQRRGLHTRANTVDHDKAVKAGGDPFPPLNALVSMCPTCHGIKTSAKDRPDRRAGSGLMRGCDADGLPIDPDHDWRREVAPPREGIGVSQTASPGARRTDGPLSDHLVADKENG